MEKEFVPYKESFKLKELGFDELCLMEYHKQVLCQNAGGEPSSNSELQDIYDKDAVIGAPLYQQAFRWFREKYPNLEFSLPLRKQKDLGIFWGGFIKKENDNYPKSYGSNFKSYEEAELECLKRLIEIVKK